jgi:hypothetical protein
MHVAAYVFRLLQRVLRSRDAQMMPATLFHLPSVKHARCLSAQVADCKADLAVPNKSEILLQEAEGAKTERDAAVAAADEASQMAADLSACGSAAGEPCATQTRQDSASSKAFTLALPGLHRRCHQ